MRTHTIRLFAVAVLAITTSGCSFPQQVRHPLMRSSIPVELPGFHPVQMMVDLDASGHPCGAMAMFGPGVDIRQLADAIDTGYARWRKPGLPYTWRIEDQRFLVALHPDGDWIRMFYIPFIDPKHPRTAISGPCTCDVPPKSN